MLHIAQGAAELGLRPQTVLALYPPAPALLGTLQGLRKGLHAEPVNLIFGFIRAERGNASTGYAS